MVHLKELTPDVEVHPGLNYKKVNRCKMSNLFLRVACKNEISRNFASKSLMRTNWKNTKTFRPISKESFARLRSIASAKWEGGQRAESPYRYLLDASTKWKEALVITKSKLPTKISSISGFLHRKFFEVMNLSLCQVLKHSDREVYMIL